MALTQAQRDAIYADIILGNLDDYASNPDSLIEVMSSEEFKQGLTCGQLSLEKLNYLFAFTMLSIQKALAESKAYAEGLTTALANALNFCNALSPRAGNLLTVDTQPDGSCKFYYGTVAGAEIANLYIDAVAGDDDALGTRAAPMKTIQAALARGSAGVQRYIWLKELQTHIVYTDKPAVLRGGQLNLNPYGTGIDNLPTVVGDYDWKSPAGKALAPTVLCPNGIPSDEGYYSANAFILTENGVLKSNAVNFTPAGHLPGFSLSGYVGMLGGGEYATQSIIMTFCNVHFADTDSILIQGSSVPLKMSMHEVTVSGATGIIVPADPSLFFNQETATSATQADMRLYIPNKLTASTAYSNFNSNLLP